MHKKPATDIGVLVEWGILVYDGTDYTFLNMTLLFAFSLATLMILRLAFFFGAIIYEGIKCENIIVSLFLLIFPEMSVFAGVYKSHTENMEKMKPQSQLPSNQSQNTKIND